MELPKNSRTSVQMTIKVLRMDKKGAQLRLKAKEFERDVALPIPEMPLLKQGKPLKVNFAFDNPEARKAFSFHLLAEGRGVIEISDFRVTTEPLPAAAVAAEANGQVAQKRPLHPITTLFGLLARQQDAMENELEKPGDERAVLPESTELRLQQYH
jgi:hypothetical protein